mgnify:CR=1 FL=1
MVTMIMIQLYLRYGFKNCSGICDGSNSKRLKQNLPLKGSVRALVLTEKQYESMEIMLGTKTFDDTPESIELMDVFWKKKIFDRI